MKTKSLKPILVTLPLVLLLTGPVAAQDDLTSAIEVVRATYKADRQAFLAETLHLTETESPAFWKLYRTYREEMDKLGDGLVKLVLEYADYYPDVPEDRAAALLKQYTALEQKYAKRRGWYFKRAGTLLPKSKALRWAQLENRMDIALRLQLAGKIPLVPAR